MRCFIIILWFFGGVGCGKFLDVAAPGSKIEASKIYEDNITAMMALYSIYGSMFNQNASPAKLARYTGMCGDELMLTWGADDEGLYQNNISTGNGYGTGLWNTGYLYIRDANDVYWGCAGSGKLDPVIRKQLMAEALFLRAYWFFYLTNLYGDIPIPITTDVQANALLPRTLQRDVYLQIISDLLAAQNDLGDNYIGSDCITISSERVRPNKATASALLARVYLYMGRYEEAAQQASAIIEKSEMYSLVPLNQVFLKNSREAIWQLMAGTPNVTKINTSEGNEFIINIPPKYKTQQAMSNTLVNAFELNDQRKKYWVGTFVDGSVVPAVTYYFPSKYKVRLGEDLNEYSMIFRLAEMYLIRAECRAQQGELAEALADLNTIRLRAGLPAMSGPNPDKYTILNAILKERQVEFFTEQGHRWFDLKRTGAVDTVMAIETPAKGGGEWNATKRLWPIPKDEIIHDPNLYQNPGY
jgi:tetratricopeptide (TPR) repeat protein